MEKHDSYIVKKGREYYQTTYTSGLGERTHVKFTASTYDAKRYRNAAEARKKAKELGGKIIRFNPLTGKQTECSQTEDEICGTCKYWAGFSGACGNGDSTHRADFMLSYEGCARWESRKEYLK